MAENDKVALFDFCETITDFQTADAYVDFVREKTRKKRMMMLHKIQVFLIKIRFIRALSILFPGLSINKKLTLLQLKGLKKNELDNFAYEYYTEMIKPHFIPVMIEKIKEYLTSGYTVGLVSGGYGIYLHYFVEEFGLDFCLSSNIEIKNGVCTGKLDGRDCLRDRKVELLNQLYQQKPTNSVAYSDSKSDMPLLLWAKEGVVVSRNNHQEWVDNKLFQEIIWEK